MYIIKTLSKQDNFEPPKRPFLCLYGFWAVMIRPSDLFQRHGFILQTSFIHYLTDVPADIEQRLNAWLDRWAGGMAHYAPLVEPLARQFAMSCQNGKRLRAALIKLGFEMVGGHTDERIYDAALAYEIFQTGILAHDDIIDNSPLRRGQPTLHKALEQRCRTDLNPDSDAAHYGVSQAICLGDLGLFLAIQLISDCGFDPALKNRAVSFFTQIVIDTIAGQMIDVELPHKRNIAELTQDDLLAVCRYKTSRYTITGPLSLGGVLAQSSAYTLEAMRAYGDHLGIAFQLKDDLLGIFGDADVTGKSATSDIAEGKMTLLYWYAVQQADAVQKQFLTTHYGTGPVDQGTHQDIQKILIDTGAKAYTERQMEHYAALAMDAVPQVTSDEAYRTLLQDLARFMIERTK